MNHSSIREVENIFPLVGASVPLVSEKTKASNRSY